MPVLEQLLRALEFKREEMIQLLLVFTLLALIATSALVVLLVAAERTRLRSFLLVCLAGSTLLLILAAMLDAMILPGMRLAAIEQGDARIRGFISLSRLVVWIGALGTAALVTAIGAIGFVYSRRVGVWILGTTIAVAVMFIVFCSLLDHTARL